MIASIFKRMSEVPDLDYNTSQDFTAAYKVRKKTRFSTLASWQWQQFFFKHQSRCQKYTVYRKMPMIVGKHERTLAIDGPYIHVRVVVVQNVERWIVFPHADLCVGSDHADGEQSRQGGLRQRQDVLVPHQQRRFVPIRQIVIVRIPDRRASRRR